jgi:hypothetical protein
MNKLHITTAPRLAYSRNAQGELVPSIDSVTGEQDVNVAGTLISIKPQAIEYTRQDGTVGTAYQGKSLIADDNGKETTVSVLINGSAIEEVAVGQTYWLTERLSKDGQYSNYSQGSLLVMEAVDASVAKNRRAMLLAKLSEAGNAPVVVAPAIRA